MQTMNDITVRSRNASLVDILDRVLDKGAFVDGDIQLCVAGVELVYLKLKLLLASTATLEKHASPPSEEKIEGGCYNGGCPVDSQPVKNSASQPVQGVEQSETQGTLKARVLRDDEPAPAFTKPPSSGIDIDPKKVEQGLAKLVLTLVELLRKLMEKQALRRMELDTLTDKQIEQLGEAFMRLHEKMKELKEVFGLKDEDLNLDLGPLGELM